MALGFLNAYLIGCGRAVCAIRLGRKELRTVDNNERTKFIDLGLGGRGFPGRAPIIFLPGDANPNAGTDLYAVH